MFFPRERRVRINEKAGRCCFPPVRWYSCWLKNSFLAGMSKLLSFVIIDCYLYQNQTITGRDVFEHTQLFRSQREPLKVTIGGLNMQEPVNNDACECFFFCQKKCVYHRVHDNIIFFFCCLSSRTMWNCDSLALQGPVSNSPTRCDWDQRKRVRRTERKEQIGTNGASRRSGRRRLRKNWFLFGMDRFWLFRGRDASLARGKGRKRRNRFSLCAEEENSADREESDSRTLASQIDRNRIEKIVWWIWWFSIKFFFFDFLHCWLLSSVSRNWSWIGFTVLPQCGAAFFFIFFAADICRAFPKNCLRIQFTVLATKWPRVARSAAIQFLTNWKKNPYDAKGDRYHFK